MSATLLPSKSRRRVAPLLPRFAFLHSSDSILVLDSATGAHLRFAFEAISLHDIGDVLSQSMHSSDLLTVLDAASISGLRARSSSDSISDSDSSSRSIISIRAGGDSFAVSDSVSVIYSFFEGTGQPTYSQIGKLLQTGTLLAQVGAAPGRKHDTIFVFDFAGGSLYGLFTNGSDSFSISDATTKIDQYQRQSSDSVTMSDRATIGQPYSSQVGLKTSQVGYIFQTGNK